MEGYICIDIEKTTYSKHLLTEIFKWIQLAHMDKIWKKGKAKWLHREERTPATRRKINVLIDKIRTSYQFIKHMPFVKACPIRDI